MSKIVYFVYHLRLRPFHVFLSIVYLKHIVSTKDFKMIPTTRPVLGKDLDTVRQQLGLLTADACWLFGLSMTRWMQICRQAPELPVRDPTLALLVRFLDQHPETCPIPRFPSVEETMALVDSAQKTSDQRFSVLLGSEKTAAYRWKRGASRQSPGVLRLMLCLKQALLAREPGTRAELIEDWGKAVAAEGVAREVSDVFTSGNWTKPKSEDKTVKEHKAELKAERQRLIEAQPESTRLLRKKGLASKASERQAAKELLLERERLKLAAAEKEAVMKTVIDEKSGDKKTASEPGIEPPPRRARTIV